MVRWHHWDDLHRCGGTHICSIRDTRTRVLKDYYIEQVKGIKGRVGDFFHKVAFGKGSFRKVVSWYDHLAIDVKGTDQGVRKSLDLQIAEFMDILDQYYGEITNWEDFNNQYSASRYIPSTEHKSRLLQMKYEIDEFLNDYVHHINQSNNYPIWKVQYRRIKQSYYYYKGKGYKCAFCRSIWERTEKHFSDGARPVGFYPTVEDFIGQGGTLTHPRALLQRQAPVPAGTRLAGKEALGGIAFAERTHAPGERAGAQCEFFFVDQTRLHIPIRHMLRAARIISRLNGCHKDK